MKTIIAGTSSIDDYSVVLEAIRDAKFPITEVICGMAKGPDSFGEKYALNNHIPITYFPADWKQYGKSAGPIRNEQMGDYGEALIAIWDGESPGTKHMISFAQKRKLKIFIKY